MVKNPEGWVFRAETQDKKDDIQGDVARAMDGLIVMIKTCHCSFPQGNDWVHLRQIV